MSEDQVAAEGPPMARKVGGWASEGKEKGKRKRDTIEEDERLKVTEEAENDEVLPVIPDLEAVQEEDLTTQIAAPPTLAINRVATYKQLDSDLHRHTYTLEGDIDLKMLAKVLSPEAEVTEDDGGWEWGKLFTEMSADIQSVWERKDKTSMEQTEATEHAAS